MLRRWRRSPKSDSSEMDTCDKVFVSSAAISVLSARMRLEKAVLSSVVLVIEDKEGSIRKT